jgi:two-component system sensor histidine kinase UhpB
MNLKLRLNLIITILLLCIVAIGGMYTTQNARKNIQAEIASTAVLAVHMLDAEIVQLGNYTGWIDEPSGVKGSVFRLSSLSDVRHVKVEFFDAQGVLRDSNRADNIIEDNPPPTWFVRAMDTVTTEMPITKRQVYQAGNTVGELVVTPDPSYEIAEIWEDTKAILRLMALFFIVANILIYWAVSKGLRPIEKVLKALTELELGNFASRLPEFSLPELTGISQKFNVMAETLQGSVESNRHLTQQIISLQEDERKNLARELHDEIGQHLTAVHIDSAAIVKSTDLTMVKESAEAIDGVVKQMMDIVHNILQRLRPTGLDELGIEAALQELVSSWQQRNRDVLMTLQVSGDFLDVSEPVLVTVFRLVQECLTNITRYADAEKVDVNVYRIGNKINLSIKDDGMGFDTQIKPTGFGLSGMRERVTGLAGEFELISHKLKGTEVKASLPCVVKE